MTNTTTKRARDLMPGDRVLGATVTHVEMRGRTALVTLSGATIPTRFPGARIMHVEVI